MITSPPIAYRFRRRASIPGTFARFGSFTMAMCVLFALLVPLVPPLTMYAIVPVDAMLPLAMGLLFIYLRWELPLVQLAMAAFLLVAGLSLLQHLGTPPFQECALRWLRMIGIMMPLFIGIADRRPERTFGIVAWIFTVTGGISVAIGILFFFMGITFRDVGQSAYFDGMYVRRAAGIFGDSSAFGHLVGLWTSFILLSVVHRVSWVRWPGLLLAVVAVITPLALVYSASRTAMVVIGVTLIYGLCVFTHRIFSSTRAWRVRTSHILAVILVLVAAIVAGYIMSGTDLSHLFERFIDVVLLRDDFNALGSGRIRNWEHHIDLFFEHPILGVGYRALSIIHDVPPDNTIISIGAEMGLLGLTAILTFVLGLFLGLARLRHSNRPYALMMMSLWVMQLAHGLFVDINTFWGSTPVLMALTGLALGMGAPTAGCKRIRINQIHSSFKAAQAAGVP